MQRGDYRWDRKHTDFAGDASEAAVRTVRQTNRNTHRMRESGPGGQGPIKSLHGLSNLGWAEIRINYRWSAGVVRRSQRRADHEAGPYRCQFYLDCGSGAAADHWQQQEWGRCAKSN